MTPEELTLIKLAYSEPMTTDEQNAQEVIYKLAGEIERLWMQLAEVNAINKSWQGMNKDMHVALEVAKYERDALNRKVESLTADNKRMWINLIGLAREVSNYVENEVSVETAVEETLTVFEAYKALKAWKDGILEHV
jgi:protein associated with RNAse G/E